MSALGHYLEEEGIATVAIPLIRPQAENTKPPRALWVPFELGRPLGPPSDAAFQKRVLLAALHMLVEDGGPVRIDDFPDDDPRARPDPAWRPPFMPAAVTNGLAESLASRLEEEVLLLHGAHRGWMAQHGRSTIGLSGLAIAEAARYVDTGGTILDWHSGLLTALKECGARRGIERSWYEFANEYRRRALRRMIGTVDPAFNIDNVHREVLDGLLTEERIDAFLPEDRREITQRWHELDTWPDFAAALVRLRARYVCVSFTILSLSLVIDSARRNNIVWDAVIPCEMLRVYKTRPEAYRLAAKYLAVSPGDILMVACHNFDLDAARGEGYRTAFVRRPEEWGPAGPPDPVPNPACDLVVAGFAELAELLGA